MPITFDATRYGPTTGWVHLEDGDMALESNLVNVGSQLGAIATEPGVPKGYFEMFVDAGGGGVSFGTSTRPEGNPSFPLDGLYYSSYIQYNWTYQYNFNQPIGGIGPNDVVRCCYDTAAGMIWVGRNGVWAGDPAAGTGGVSATLGDVYAAAGVYVNTSSVAKVTLRLTEESFTYAPPAGFNAYEASGSPPPAPALPILSSCYV